MVVHHAHRLHVGIDNSAAHELESPVLQVLAQGIGFRGVGRDVLHDLAAVPHGLAAYKPPNICVEAAKLLLDGQECSGVAHGGTNLQAISYDPGVPQQGLDFLFAEAGDPDRGEVGESFPIAISFIEDGGPTQPSLGALQDEELEVLVVIVDRNSPFVVVVFQIEVSHPLSPAAALFDFGFSFHCRFN